TTRRDMASGRVAALDLVESLHRGRPASKRQIEQRAIPAFCSREDQWVGPQALPRQGLPRRERVVAATDQHETVLQQGDAIKLGMLRLSEMDAEFRFAPQNSLGDSFR